MSNQGDGRFAAFLEEELARMGVSRAEFARRVHVAPNTVRNWLHDERPSQEMCLHLAEVLERSALWVLEAAGYAPGVTGLRDLVEQLNADNDRLMALLRRVPPRDGVHTGLPTLLDYLAARDYSFRVVPWWRGTTRRRHYADWVVFDPESVDSRRRANETPQQYIEGNHAAAIALAMGWWDGPENWEHALTGSRRPAASDLVLNVPRFIANRSALGHRRGSTPLDGVDRIPRDIAVAGGHWCGQPEVARYLAEWLDYNYSLPALAASVVHQVLVQRWDAPNWHADRLAHIRTFALQAPITRKRVWGVDYWDDASTVTAITDTAMPPHIVLLSPDDALYEYAATRRQELGHAGARSRAEDLEIMRTAGAEVRTLVEHLPAAHRTIVDVAPALGVWSDDGRSTLAAMDAWMDHYAATAAHIHRCLTGSEPPTEEELAA